APSAPAPSPSWTSGRSRSWATGWTRRSPGCSRPGSPRAGSRRSRARALAPPDRPPSPAPRLAGLRDPEPPGIDAEPPRLRLGSPRRLLEGLVGQVERAPVDRHEEPAAHVAEEAEPLLRCRVAEPHHLGRHVGADGDGGQVERTQAPADLRQALPVPGVAGEVEPLRSA